MEECSLMNHFGQTVQTLLALLVLVVLMMEWIYELLVAKQRQITPKRDMIQFVFDVFKISTGALISHGFNVLASSVLKTKGSEGSECGLYAIVFIYEGCGIPFVQLLMYCTVKFAKTREHESLNWNIIAQPGIYNAKLEDIANDFFPSRKFWFRVTLTLIASLTSLVIFLELDISTIPRYSGPVFVFIYVFAFLYTSFEAKLQTFAWVCIKCCEKVIWTIFAIAQAPYFIRWSEMMKMPGHPKLEAMLYITGIPMLVNTVMFLMMSRISRLELSCIPSRERSIKDLSFDIPEALNVGIVYGIFNNSTIWLLCCLLLRSWEVVFILFLSTVILPVGMAVIVIMIGRVVVNRSYASRKQKDEEPEKSFLNKEKETAEKAFDMEPVLDVGSKDNILPKDSVW